MLGPFEGSCGFSAANDPRQEAGQKGSSSPPNQPPATTVHASAFERSSGSHIKAEICLFVIGIADRHEIMVRWVCSQASASTTAASACRKRRWHCLPCSAKPREWICHQAKRSNA